jgi:predicted NBD/HSP70 family sugar kinase/biotin operon repressor
MAVRSLKEVSGNSQVMKVRNKILVRNLIRTESPISRNKIAKITGLSPSTVTGIVRELMDEGIVWEVGSDASTGGRKPVNLAIKSEAAGVVGMRLQQGYVVVGIMDLNNDVRAQRRLAIDTSRPEKVVRLISNSLPELSLEANIPLDRCLRAGLASPGLINIETGILERSVNLGWQNVPIRYMLEQALGMPVYLENVSNAAVLAHQLYGQGIGHSNMIYLTLSVGISAGVIMNGEIFGGKGGYACEVGHMAVSTADGFVCNCGNKGCLEGLCGLKNILKLMASYSSRFKGATVPASLEEMVIEVENGNSLVAAVLEEIGAWLGIAIVNLVHLFHPDVVILGGELTLFYERLAKSMHQVLVQRMLPEFRSRTQIVVSEMLDPGLIGAGAIALQHVLNKETILEQVP